MLILCQMYKKKFSLSRCRVWTSPEPGLGMLVPRVVQRIRRRCRPRRVIRFDSRSHSQVVRKFCVSQQLRLKLWLQSGDRTCTGLTLVQFHISVPSGDTLELEWV